MLYVRTLPPSSVETLTTALKGPRLTVKKDACTEYMVYSSKPVKVFWTTLSFEAALRLLERCMVKV